MLHTHFVISVAWMFFVFEIFSIFPKIGNICPISNQSKRPCEPFMPSLFVEFQRRRLKLLVEGRLHVDFINVLNILKVIRVLNLVLVETLSPDDLSSTSLLE